ncbi:MAG: hypothetical protein U5N85_13585 [Arcicella sp.]|nr:hypothetical protein [Arcicella sp.]
MQDLSVTLIQTDLYWENPTANLANLEEKNRHNKYSNRLDYFTRNVQYGLHDGCKISG